VPDPVPIPHCHALSPTGSLSTNAASGLLSAHWEAEYKVFHLLATPPLTIVYPAGTDTFTRPEPAAVTVVQLVPGGTTQLCEAHFKNPGVLLSSPILQLQEMSASDKILSMNADDAAVVPLTLFSATARFCKPPPSTSHPSGGDTLTDNEPLLLVN